MLRLWLIVTAFTLHSATAELTSEPYGNFLAHHERVILDVDHIETQLETGRRRRAVAGKPEGFIRVKVSTFGEDLTLHLERTEGYFAPGFTVQEAGDDYVKDVHVDMARFYRGHVLGKQRTFVRATILPGGKVDASIELPHDTYFIEPVDENDSHKSMWSNHNHIAYRLSDYRSGGLDNATVHTCGNSRAELQAELRATVKPTSDPSATLLNRARRAPFDDTKKTCTLHLAADHLFFEEHGSSSVAVTNDMITFVEEITRIYRATVFNSGGSDIIGINFAISKISIFTTVIC